MKRQIAVELQEFAQKIADNYSRGDRPLNSNGDKFEIESIKPLSDDTAAITFIKTSGKKAVAFAYYLRYYGKWNYFFPTDAHLLGMQSVQKIKLDVEISNFNKNE